MCTCVFINVFLCCTCRVERLSVVDNDTILLINLNDVVLCMRLLYVHKYV